MFSYMERYDIIFEAIFSKDIFYFEGFFSYLSNNIYSEMCKYFAMFLFLVRRFYVWRMIQRY